MTLDDELPRSTHQAHACSCRQEPTFLPHFAAADVPNVSYVRLNVLAADFADAMRDLVDGAGGHPTVVLGMHLCGLLSLAAIALLEAVPRVEAVVLAPCCLPQRAKGAAVGTPAAVFEATAPDEQYAAWCAFLHSRLSAAAATSAATSAAGIHAGITTCSECETQEVADVTMEIEPALVSQKNALLVAQVRRCADVR